MGRGELEEARGEALRARGGLDVGIRAAEHHDPADARSVLAQELRERHDRHELDADGVLVVRDLGADRPGGVEVERVAVGAMTPGPQTFATSATLASGRAARIARSVGGCPSTLSLNLILACWMTKSLASDVSSGAAVAMSFAVMPNRTFRSGPKGSATLPSAARGSVALGAVGLSSAFGLSSALPQATRASVTTTTVRFIDRPYRQRVLLRGPTGSEPPSNVSRIPALADANARALVVTWAR